MCPWSIEGFHPPSAPRREPPTSKVETEVDVKYHLEDLPQPTRPQTAKQDGDRIGKQFLCGIDYVWKKRNKRPNVGGVSIRSRNGAPSRKGCAVNGQITKASNK